MTTWLWIADAFVVEAPQQVGYRCLGTELSYLAPGDDDNSAPLAQWHDNEAARYRRLVVAAKPEFNEKDESWEWEPGAGTPPEYAGTWRARDLRLDDAAWISPNEHFADLGHFVEFCRDDMGLNNDWVKEVLFGKGLDE